MWILIQGDWCPSTKGHFRRGDTQGEHRVMMKAEVEVMHLRAKAPQRSPANHQKPGEKQGMDPPLAALRSNQPCRHRELRLLASRTVRRRLWFKPPH